MTREEANRTIATEFFGWLPYGEGKWQTPELAGTLCFTRDLPDYCGNADASKQLRDKLVSEGAYVELRMLQGGIRQCAYSGRRGSHVGHHGSSEFLAVVNCALMSIGINEEVEC